MPKSKNDELDFEGCDYEKDTTIDKYNLDEECEQHAEKAAYYKRLRAVARREWQRASENKKTIRSKLILQAKRKGGEKLMRVDRITDPAVEAWYRTQSEYMEAAQEEVDAEYKYNVLEAAVESMTDKKHNLQELGELWQGGYWSGDVKAQTQNASDQKQKDNLRKRRKTNG